jgi:hypothetical protein
MVLGQMHRHIHLATTSEDGRLWTIHIGRLTAAYGVWTAFEKGWGLR